ncbi:hypothetical protein [Elioraea sp.]|uniref:hypothetical protein n=1 Tax=Elioraea sp. TaxID=2185103 RepID=UPI0021DEF79D|nr:hypothetical protein [Elioraea sp.]GIX10377.1 MAG: hypothetical protein KatS3mg116_2087 [Elioraea sp.]
MARDCGAACPYAANAPETVEGAACWRAAAAAITPDFAGARLDVASALAVAASLGAQGWIAAELLGAIAAGLADAQAARRDAAGAMREPRHD